MGKRNKVEMFFDKDSGKSTYIIHAFGTRFEGNAQCCDEDRDMMSERTGMEIASLRAEVKLLKHQLKNIINPKISVLKYILGTTDNSKKEVKDSYAYKLAHDELWRLVQSQKGIRKVIDSYLDSIQSYIQEKDKLYKKIRANRENT